MAAKKNTGIVGIQGNVDDATHERAARAQREAINAAADDIEAGKAPSDPTWIAAVLRKAAGAISLVQPGAPARVDHGALAFRYGWMRTHDALSDRDAILELEADPSFGISAQGIKNALTPSVKANALRQFEGARLLRKKSTTKPRT